MKMALNAKLPRICTHGLVKLEKILDKDMQVLEQDSGGSTLFLAEKVKSVTSPEHDPSWAELVSRRITNQENTGYFIPPDTDCHEEEFKSKYGLGQVGRCFKEQVKAAEKFANESLDVVIIDGRARAACLKQVHSKVKQGGNILFDNSGRPDFRCPISFYLNDWKREDFQGEAVFVAFFNSTSIFQKPIVSKQRNCLKVETSPVEYIIGRPFI